MDKVYIDGETADGIVVASLRDSMECLETQIKRLKSKKKLADFEKRDLAESVKSLDAMEEVYDYYGGNNRE
jgi:hypothetical protein